MKKVTYDEFYDFLENKKYTRDLGPYPNSEYYVEYETNKILGLYFYDKDSKTDTFKLKK